MPVDHTEVIQLNVGGEYFYTTRQTLTKIDESTLAILFNGRWENELNKDSSNTPFFDFNRILFRHLLDQLQIMEPDDSIELYPPFEPSLVEPFRKMLRKLGLQQLLPSEKKNVITFNVGGQMITSQRTTFIQASNATSMTLNNENDVFIDYDPKLFQDLISQLRKNSYGDISYPKLSLHEEKIAFKKLLNDLNIHRK